MWTEKGWMVDSLEKQLEIRAAGAVLWRRNTQGHAEIAIVHRPRYDDWSLPKGKLDADETLPAAAVREVQEETGASCVLGRLLTKARYTVPTHGDNGIAPKEVSYYSARATSGSFVPNSEVDELRWLDPFSARWMLSYATETEALDAFTSIAPEATTVLLVRHAKAGKRENWEDRKSVV